MALPTFRPSFKGDIEELYAGGGLMYSVLSCVFAVTIVLVNYQLVNSRDSDSKRRKKLGRCNGYVMLLTIYVVICITNCICIQL